MHNLDLFEHVAQAYAQPVSGKLSNTELYRMAAGRALTPNEIAKHKAPLGRACTMHNTFNRKVRWHQQTLRQLGLLERTPGQRSVWQLTAKGKKQLQTVPDGVVELGFSTELGVSILGNCRDVFSKINEPVFCVLTSPPYPLRNPRAYGNPPISEYIDFICGVLEPIVANLVEGGNVALSLSNDIFEQGSPARSLYLERLTIALEDRLGLRLMDRLIWKSNKPPGPYQWASKERMQLNTAYEPVLWFSNNPNKCIADNRRVLEPHTAAHKKVIAQGGEKCARVNGDGAYSIRHGAFANDTVGRIPKNVLEIGNTCASQRMYKSMAKDLGLPVHGAPMPLALARKLVKFLTDVGQLVVDPFGGSMTTPLASELEGRRWLATDNVPGFVYGGAQRFRMCEGFEFGVV